MNDIKKDPFGEYIRNLPPTRKELGQAWSTAIGLQDVDGLKPSEYLYETARKSIDGEISVDEAGDLINSYYESKDGRLAAETRTEEADKVSARIAKLLSEKAFIFSPTQYISIHRELFNGIYSHAGKIRDYNITKKEWVLDGDTVSYGGAIDLRETLDYDFSQERDFKFNGLTMDETIHHLAVFISRLWQIHAFGEGNTRTTAVFFFKYLRMLGFDAENDMFAENSWYFRNALVRANYTNIKEGIYETTEFLEKFLRNLLLGEKHELHNREMHIRGEFLLGHADPINDPIKTQTHLHRSGKDMNTTQNTITKSTTPVLAICYDFDRTLTPDDMQAQGYIQDIGWDIDKFWAESNAIAEANNMDQTLAYMYKMVKFIHLKVTRAEVRVGENALLISVASTCM